MKLAFAGPDSLLDTEQKIARPRQIYLGYDERDYLSMEQRGEAKSATAD
jgi:citrate synthase